MRRLWLCLAMLALPAGADTWALIVGVEEYEDGEITPLQFAVADARAFAEQLVAAGLDQRTIRLLTSNSLEPSLRPTRNNVLNAIAAMADRAQADDTFLFFFAGHGLQRGEGHPPLLLTVDTNRRLPDQTALALHDLEQALAMLPCGRLLLFIDACRNDPDSGRAEGDNTLSGDLARNLRPRRTAGDLRPEQQSACLFACDVGQRAWEMGSAGHGAFTFYLLEALAGAAAGENGLITVGAAVDYVTRRLAAWCVQRGKPLQVPRLVGEAGGWPLLRAPEPAGVRLALDSDPPGAQVYLDARDTGQITPCEVLIPFAGDVRTQAVWLEFRRIGYRAKRLEVTVDRQRGAEVPTVALQRVQPVVEDPLDPIAVPLSLGPRRDVPDQLRDEATVQRHLAALAGAVRQWAAGNGGRFPPSLKWHETLANWLPDDLLELLRGGRPSYAYSGAPAGLPLTTADPRATVVFFESDAPGPGAVAHPLLASYDRRGDHAFWSVRRDLSVQRERLTGVDLQRNQQAAEPLWWLRTLGEGIWQLALRSGYPDPSQWTVRLVEAGLWPSDLPAVVKSHTVYYNARLKGLRPADLGSLDATVIAWIGRGARAGFETAASPAGVGIEGRDEYLVLTAGGWTQILTGAQLSAMMAVDMPAPRQPEPPSLFAQTQRNLERLHTALRTVTIALTRLPTGDRWQDMIEAELEDATVMHLPEHPHAYALNPWLAGRPWPGEPRTIVLYESRLGTRNTSGQAESAVPEVGWHYGKVAVLYADGEVALLPPAEVRALIARGG